MKGINGKTFAVLMAVMMLLASCSSGSTAQGQTESSSEVDKDSAQGRREEMWNYRDDKNVNQILYVTHTEGSQAIAELYEKIPEENNAWVLVFRTDAFIGVNQMGEIYEGSGRTLLETTV